MGNPIVNLDQSEAWNGYEGRHWATYPERYDALNDAVNDHLLDDLPVVAGSRVLDVGCGTGRVARLAGGRGATVLGVDLSEPMLREAVAAAEREGLGGVAFARGDAQVHPYPREGFDAVVSRFGVMFFADPVAAFANLRRALRPGGRLAFVCSRGHRSMDQTKIYRAIGTVVSVPDFTGYTGPASFGDPAYTERILTGAGFAEVTSTAVDVPQVWGRGRRGRGRLPDGLGARAALAARGRGRRDGSLPCPGRRAGGLPRLHDRGWGRRADRPALARYRRAPLNPESRTAPERDRGTSPCADRTRPVIVGARPDIPQ